MKNLPVIATSALLTFLMVAPSYAAPTQVATAHSQIDMNKAIEIAQQKAQGKVKSISFDASDSEYEVELASQDAKYEVKVNASTGEVTNVEKETLDNDDVTKYKALNASKIDLVQAMQIVKRHGQVIKAEFDIENNKPVYELKTLRNSQKYDIVVDASSGKIIHTERD